MVVYNGKACDGVPSFSMANHDAFLGKGEVSQYFEINTTIIIINIYISLFFEVTQSALCILLIIFLLSITDYSCLL